jgi:4-hydroxy-tetrahydrodipicolinate synthase
LVDFHVENGTDAIVAVGSTGESATLDLDEHIRVIRKVVEYAAGRLPVIGGTGSNSTREALELTREAKEAGCAASLLITPYYNKPTQEGLFLHFKMIAEQVDIPQILYNVPGRTACDLLPETVARLSVIPNIIGIKEAFGTLDRIRQVLAVCGSDFAVYSGEDALACDSILLGGKGVISVTANVAPRLMADMCRAAAEGDREKAMQIDSRLAALHKTLFIETNPIPVKWAVSQMGLIPDGIRLPMTPLLPAHHEAVRAALRQAGVLE